jgi:hypothetical protein
MSLLSQSSYSENSFEMSLNHFYQQAMPTSLDIELGFSGALSISSNFCTYSGNRIQITKDGVYSVYMDAKARIIKDFGTTNFAYFRLYAGPETKVIAGGSAIASQNDFGVTNFFYNDFGTSAEVYRNIPGLIETGPSVNGVRVRGRIYTKMTVSLQAGDYIYLRYNTSGTSSSASTIALDGKISIQRFA